jgi:hypothetical protein
MTRMKVQIVDDLEHDDFHRIAATIYGKGFIKLFAECVGLEPAPLIADYMRTVNGGAEDTPASREDDTPAPPPEHLSAPEQPEANDLFAFASSRRRRITPAHGRPLAQVAGPLPPAPPPTPATTEAEAPPARHHIRSVHRPFSAAIRRLGKSMRDRAAMLAENLKDRLSNLNWSDRLLKRVGIVLAALLVLLVLVALIRFFATRVGPRPPADHELLLFIPPPEPYVE